MTQTLDEFKRSLDENLGSCTQSLFVDEDEEETASSIQKTETVEKESSEISISSDYEIKTIAANAKTKYDLGDLIDDFCQINSIHKETLAKDFNSRYKTELSDIKAREAIVSTFFNCDVAGISDAIPISVFAEVVSTQGKAVSSAGYTQNLYPELYDELMSEVKTVEARAEVSDGDSLVEESLPESRVSKIEVKQSMSNSFNKSTLLEQELQNDEYPDFVVEQVQGGNVSEDIFKQCEDLFLAILFSEFERWMKISASNLIARCRDSENYTNVMYQLLAAFYEDGSITREDLLMYLWALNSEGAQALLDAGIDFTSIFLATDTVPNYYAFTNAVWMLAFNELDLDDVPESILLSVFNGSSIHLYPVDLIWYAFAGFKSKYSNPFLVFKGTNALVLHMNENDSQELLNKVDTQVSFYPKNSESFVHSSVNEYVRKAILAGDICGDPTIFNLDCYVAKLKEESGVVSQEAIEFVSKGNSTDPSDLLEIAEFDFVFSALVKGNFMFLIAGSSQFRFILGELRFVPFTSEENYNFYRFLYRFFYSKKNAGGHTYKFSLEPNMTALLNKQSTDVRINGIPGLVIQSNKDFLGSLDSYSADLQEIKELRLDILEGDPRLTFTY